MSIQEKREKIEDACSELSIRRQCELLELSRASVYYEPTPVSKEKLQLLRRIDEIFTELPFYGSRRILESLKREGYEICREKVQGLMRELGLQAIYPKKNLSKSNSEHTIYPYLLNDIKIEKTNQVWSTDITYIRLEHGFLYLTAIIDWYSRYVLAWRLSNSMDVYFCLEALEEALTLGNPEIFNTDQGAQFTSNDFTGKLKSKGIKISMDGRGRAFDNIFIERLWRSVKYEEVYIKNYQVYKDAKNGLETYFSFYNNCRYHQSLGYKTPFEMHYNKERAVKLKYEIYNY